VLFRSAGIPNDAKVVLQFIDSEKIDEENCADVLGKMDGILVPGGFGPRGVEGKILAAKYARENKVPYFGICLGMQIAVIEYSRHIAGMKDANSTEFDKKTRYPVIYLMKEWVNERTGQVEKRDVTSDKGGTLRLGAYPCKLMSGSFAYDAYGVDEISERHRHRY
jgi:CTP synthase